MRKLFSREPQASAGDNPALACGSRLNEAERIRHHLRVRRSNVQRLPFPR
jgi:hypothetical protein